MTDVSARELREAASTAHRRGETDAAIALFEQIVDRYPGTTEAIEARFYLSSIGRGRQRKPPQRAALDNAAVPERSLKK
jgi:hypothetical protein